MPLPMMMKSKWSMISLKEWRGEEVTRWWVDKIAEAERIR